MDLSFVQDNPSMSAAVRTLQDRQGLQAGSPDEITHMLGWINDADLVRRADTFGKNDYGRYLRGML